MSVNTETRNAAQRTIFAARRLEVHHESWSQNEKGAKFAPFPVTSLIRR
jgi:hypothetical protein